MIHEKIDAGAHASGMSRYLWWLLSAAVLAVAIVRGGSVCLNSLRRFAKWISASIMPPPSLVPAR